MHTTYSSLPLSFSSQTERAAGTEPEDAHTHSRYSFKITKKEGRTQNEIRNTEHEAPAHLAAVTEKAMHTNIGSRVTLFEHINAGQVDEEEKKKATEEAFKANRRLSIQIRQHHEQSPSHLLPQQKQDNLEDGQHHS